MMDFQFLGRPAVAILMLSLTGCGGVDLGVGTGGEQTGGLTTGGADGIGTLTASYVILNLATGSLDTRAGLPTLTSDAQFRDQSLVFKRVAVAGSEPILIAVFETTQGQWSRVAPTAVQPWTNAPSSVVGSAAVTGDRPAFNLAYASIELGLTAWNRNHKAQLHLPSAAQWSTAAAVGTTTAYWWGDQADRTTILTRAAVADVADGVKGPRIVGSLTPNPQGLYDTSGNVWEWIAGGKELRGGSWSDSISAATTSTVLDAAGAGITDLTEHVLAGARLVLVP